MDTSGFSQVGRYGTLSLMKRQEPDTVVTAFGIDTEELTFGRDPSCSVRLYYSDVSLVHCKITFEDRKAFLVVLGSTGLLVDGCKVYPNGSGGLPNTVPLSNNSEIEIHHKRFRFSYPPKEIRAALFATPAKPDRKPRLSMIRSAQVFTPRPSKDPRENLKILKSPMKNAFRSPMKPSALSRTPVSAQIEEEEEEETEEEEIILVDGNHPRVVEEDKDLVILEDVVVPIPPPVVVVEPPRTPSRRRSQSLHRAVLIRSAQRAVIQHEIVRRQDEEEEMEVLDTIASDRVISDDDEQDMSIDRHDGQEHPPSDEDTDSEEEETKEETKQVHDQRKSLWRKSLERLWPFRGSSPTIEPEEEGDAEQEEDNSEEEAEEEVHEREDQPEELRSLPQASPIRRPLGSFMTPQIKQSKSNPFNRGETPRGRMGGGPPIRYSLGGGEHGKLPQEVAWRVKDIVVPLKGKDDSNPPQAGPSSSDTPRHGNVLGQPQPSPTRGRPEVTAEERKAIRQRRRSALREVDTYFAGGIPGMSPSKATPAPAHTGFDDVNNPFRSVSPTKQFGLLSPIKDLSRRLSTDEEAEKLDTRSLLERMKETVEGMKRRRSIVDTPGLSPAKSNIRSTSPTQEISRTPLFGPTFDEVADHDKENDENAMDVDEPFSLTSPKPVNHSYNQVSQEETSLVSRQSLVPNHEEIPNVPLIVEDNVIDESNRPQESEPEPTQLIAPLRRSTRSRSKTPQPPVQDPELASDMSEEDPDPEANDDDDIAPPVTAKRIFRKTATNDKEIATTVPIRRTRKPTVEPEEPEQSQPVRRGRKPTTPAPEEPVEPLPTAKRSTRKAATKEGKEVPASQTVRRGRPPKAITSTDEGTTTTTKRSATRSRVGTKVVPVEVDDDDPLDALNGDDSEDETNQLPAPVPKAAAVRGRKPVVVKKEPAPVALKTATRIARPTATTSTTRTSSNTTTATKTPAPTMRGRPKKTPATAPAVVQVQVDKENEPGTSRRAAGKVTSTIATTASEEGGVVVKVSRTTSTRKTKVKQEEGESDPVATTAAKSRLPARTTRTRTKTS